MQDFLELVGWFFKLRRRQKARNLAEEGEVSSLLRF